MPQRERPGWRAELPQVVGQATRSAAATGERGRRPRAHHFRAVHPGARVLDFEGGFFASRRKGLTLFLCSKNVLARPVLFGVYAAIKFRAEDVEFGGGGVTKVGVPVIP